MVCAERTIGFEIILNTPDRTFRCCGPCGISFKSIYRVLDRWMVCAKHTISSEIILDTPDGTPS
jgi:hypothetical protein